MNGKLGCKLINNLKKALRAPFTDCSVTFWYLGRKYTTNLSRPCTRITRGTIGGRDLNEELLKGTGQPGACVFVVVKSVHCAEISPLSQCWERKNGAAFEPLKEQKRN